MAKKDKKDSVEETQEATQPAQDTAETVQGLQLSDLQIMMQIIDVVTQRGAIKADEMGAVGAVYNKLRLFVVRLHKRLRKHLLQKKQTAPTIKEIIND